VLSTQLWYYQFIESALSIPSLPPTAASILLGDTVSVLSSNALYDPKPC
jgi:hypothetical protein